MYNNQAESYTILKACQLAKEVGFKCIQVFGDTELFIKMLNSNGLFNNSTLKLILQRIRNSMKDFKLVDSFHILIDFNGKADSLPSKSCLLAQGHLTLNGEIDIFQPIPSVFLGFSFCKTQLIF